MKDLSYIPDCKCNMGQRKERHLRAVSSPEHERERPILQGVQAWIDYARSHEARFESPIGEDYFLREGWAQWGRSLMSLLNGDLGTRIDCGTLDAILRDNLTEQGYDCDLDQWKE